MSEYESRLVKCFSNSVLGVNLTTILIDMEPWFIAKEVATLLGYENTKQAILVNVDELDQKMLSYDECKQLFGQKSTNNETLENTDDSRGLSDRPRNNSININSQGMKFINESGLYTLIARSNKPEARRFQRWVTSEVLPSIRKTGQYAIQKQTPSYAIEDPIERANISTFFLACEFSYQHLSLAFYRACYLCWKLFYKDRKRDIPPFSFKKILGYDSDKLQQQLIDETLNKSLLTKNLI